MFLIGLGALLVLGGVLYSAVSCIWCALLFGGDRLAARIPAGRFAALWSRDGAAWDSWGSKRTGRAYSPYGNRCSSVDVGGQFLTSVTRGLPL